MPFFFSSFPEETMSRRFPPTKKRKEKKKKEERIDVKRDRATFHGNVQSKRINELEIIIKKKKEE